MALRDLACVIQISRLLVVCVCGVACAFRLCLATSLLASAHGVLREVARCHLKGGKEGCEGEREGWSVAMAASVAA